MGEGERQCVDGDARDSFSLPHVVSMHCNAAEIGKARVCKRQLESSIFGIKISLHGQIIDLATCHV